MKAAVYHGTRDLRIESVPEPGPPGPGELVLEVLRGAVCGSDVSEFLHGPHFTPLTERHPASEHLGPMIIGHEFVGRVIAVGADVDQRRIGQRVVPGAGMWCGRCEPCRAGRTNLCHRYYTLGLNANGGLAEMATVPARMCHPVPDGCSDEAAAMAQPLAVALHAVRRSGAVPGQTIALMGAGGIGAFMLAAATAQGLGPVVVIDVDNDRLARAAKFGAAHLVNARTDDALAGIRSVTGGAGVDVFIEASGVSHGPALALDAVRPGGVILLVGLQAEPRPLDLRGMVLREVNVATTMAHVCDVDLPASLELLATTDIARTVLDRVIPLDRLVEDGLLAMSEGRARGKVVVDTRAAP